MLLEDLIAGLPVVVHDANARTLHVQGVTEDSRRVQPGWLFIARPGTKRDGSTFIAEARRRGAAAVLARGADDPNVGLTCDDPAGMAATLAERWHGSPSTVLSVMGVTGTNGKTTLAWLVRQLMNAGGRRCGLMGTIEIDEGQAARPAELTTPAAEDISSSLARMLANGCDAAAMEVSSHALDQKRTAGLCFRVGVFTNLSGDHLDYHGSMDAYAAAKARLFEQLDSRAVAIVNADDAAAERMLRGCQARVVRCSMREPADATVHVRADGLNSSIEVHGPWGSLHTRLPLVGAHNAMNALQAVAAAHELGLDAQALAPAMPTLSPPPGRLEPVLAQGVEGPSVLVDYAHTDDALEKALAAVAERKGDGRLWVVFGCGGDRDRTKRPRMGAVAGRLADRVVVTSDNPRSEDPRAIVEEVLAGVPTAAWKTSEPDRRAAIELAISQADTQDVVVIAGKGHEDYQIISDGMGGTTKRDFDDRLIARAALQARAGVAGGVQ